MKYQLFPELSESEYAELKADIEERGVMVPLEYDEEGNLLDGHHRKRICDELGITDFPTVTRQGMTEQEKRQHVRKLNIARRHLSKEQRNQIIKDMRAEGVTNQEIADAVGVSEATARRVSSNDETESPTTVTGKDGKTYPATKQRSEKGKPGGGLNTSSIITPVSDGPATSEPAADSDEDDWYEEGPFPDESPAPQTDSKPDTEQEFRMQKSKTVKTCEALMRELDALHRIKPRLDDHDWTIGRTKGILQSVKNW